MKKTLLISIALVLIASFVKAQTIDEILEKHFATIGQEKLNDVNEVMVYARAIQGPNEFPVKIFLKRPNKLRVEIEVQGQKIIQAYDGEKAWQINPMAGTTDALEITGPQLKGFRWTADMDGLLYNYDEKGFEAKLLDDKDYEGTKVYKIQLEDEEGDKMTFYIDAENYVILANIVNMTIQGNEVEQETVFSNYKMIDGVAYPFEQEIKMNGQIIRQSVTDSVLTEVQINDSIFTMPEKKIEPATEESPENNN